MKRNLKFDWSFIGIAMVIIATFAMSAPNGPAPSAEPCCFDNDRFEGTCKIVPGEAETCSSILEYLNNPMSTGKSYCGGASVRGGWVQVDCKKGKSPKQECAARPTTGVGKPVSSLPQNHLGRLFSNNLE